jgi:hypothetical protein
MKLFTTCFLLLSTSSSCPIQQNKFGLLVKKKRTKKQLQQLVVLDIDSVDFLLT